MQRYLLTNTGANHENKAAMVRRATNKGGRYYALNNSGQPNTRQQNAMRAIIRNGIEPTINKKSKYNADNTTRKAGMKNINGLRPYVYPCPIADGLMPHQEAAAILSTRLGNPDKASNPTKREDGYIPKSELLFHSAGSGKTLTMWRIFFWWCIRWWAERPKYTLPVGINTPISSVANGKNSDTPKALPCIVIFISQFNEVDNMGQGELVQFENILGQQVKRASSLKYKQLVRNNFINALPDQKVVALFKRSKEDDISKPPRWRRSEPKESHIQYNYNNSTQYYASSGKEDRHPMLTGAFPMLAACMGYSQPKIDLGVTVTLPGGFKGPQGIPMFNLYMQMKAYVYMCSLASNDKEKTETIINPSIARGAYYEFLRLFIIQNYAKALESSFGASGKSETTKQAIAQEAGREVEYYTLPWDSNGEVTLSDVNVGDFVRFQVMRKVKDLTTRFDSDDEHKHTWAEDKKMYDTHFTQFCERNRGGVSPLFYVKKIKKNEKGKYEIGLQRVLIHDITTESHFCYPLKDGFLKSYFRLYDIYRFNRPIASFKELRLDNAMMSETQQTCSANGLMTILKQAGAELKVKDDWAPTRVEMNKDKENKMLMWWLACGKGVLPSHPAFTPGGKFQGGSVLANHWEWLGMKTGKSKSYSATPRMPATLMVGMSAELAVSVFKRLPSKSLIMVDEVQKYSGEQGSDVTTITNPFKKEQVDVKKGMKCLLSGAMSSSTNSGRSASQSSNPNVCGDYSSAPGDCVGVFASATPFVVDLSDKKNKVNELEELVRMIGTSKRVSIPPFLPTMANKPKEALNKYRKSVETLLGQSNLLVSFIDLDRDPLVIPTLTKRGIMKSGRGSLVDVWNVRNIKSRLSKRDGGTALTVEKRIGVLGGDQVPQVPTRAAKPTEKAAVATKKAAKGSKSRPTPQMNFIRAMGF